MAATTRWHARLAAVLAGIALVWTGAVLAPALAGPEDNPPDKCFEMNDNLDLPTCTYTNGHWQVSYDDPGLGGSGMPAIFPVLFVLVVLLGIGGAVWRVSTARSMARRSGMDEDEAARMALLSDDGLEATYLASNLRRQEAPAAPSPPVDVRARLRELQELRDEGLITAEEHDGRRRAILDSI